MKKLLFLSYALFLLGVTFFSYFFIDPNFIYLSDVYSFLPFLGKWIKILGFIIMFVVFLSFYLWTLRMYQSKKLSQKEGNLLIVFSVLCLLFSYPAMLSHDIFNYIATAKVTYFYGENPYIIMPIEFFGDPLLLFMHAANKTALYGPLWIMISSIPHFLGFGNFLLTMFFMKALIAAFYLLLLFTMYKVSKNYFAVLFFGLNPLVLIETLMSGHNDVVMLCLLFVSYFLLLKKHVVGSICFFLFSVFIKYATLILLPLFALNIWKQRKGKRINEQQIYEWSLYLMLLVFFLSFLREEIYPWYAIWFLPFVGMVRQKMLQALAIILSFSLLFRYIPYMILVTHFGPTPLLKSIVTFLPLLFVMAFFVWRKKAWSKSIFR